MMSRYTLLVFALVPLVVAACADLDSGSETRTLETAEAALPVSTSPTVRMGWDADAEELVVSVEFGEQGGSGVMLFGPPALDREGACLQSGQCTELGVVLRQRVRFAGGNWERLTRRVDLRGGAAGSGVVCAQFLTRDGLTSPECERVTRPGEDAREPEVDPIEEARRLANLCRHVGDPITCATTDGCWPWDGVCRPGGAACGTGDEPYCDMAADQCSAEPDRASCFYNGDGCVWLFGSCAPSGADVDEAACSALGLGACLDRIDCAVSGTACVSAE